MFFKTRGKNKFGSRVFGVWVIFGVLPILLLGAYITQSFAEPVFVANQLTAKPNRCIALHEGQDCYLNLKLIWKTEASGSYCLYQFQGEEPIKCWQHSSAGEYAIEFRSNKSIMYVIRKLNDQEIITKTTVTVAWVYNSNSRKTNWRLF